MSRTIKQKFHDEYISLVVKALRVCISGNEQAFVREFPQRITFNTESRKRNFNKVNTMVSPWSNRLRSARGLVRRPFRHKASKTCKRFWRVYIGLFATARRVLTSGLSRKRERQRET